MGPDADRTRGQATTLSLQETQGPVPAGRAPTGGPEQ